MAEYIERESTLHRMKVDIRPPFAVVADMPAADVEPVVHGRWEWIGPYRYNDDGVIGTCSVCKERLRLFAYNYCPNCGAKMDLKQKEEST